MGSESILGDQNLGMITELAKLKKNDPKGYKELVDNIKAVMKDLYKIVTEVMMDVAKNINKLEDNEKEHNKFIKYENP